MRVQVTYDQQRNPPAPILPIRLGRPGTDPNVLLAALVDTGADATVIPQALATRLDLPALADVTIAGMGGLSQRATVYGAVVEVGGSRWPAQVIALGSEPLVGRDLLNQWVATFRGPARVLDIQAPEQSSKAR